MNERIAPLNAPFDLVHSLARFSTADGMMNPDAVRRSFQLTRAQLVDIIGLASLVPASSRVSAGLRQDQRLRELLGILLRAEPIFGGGRLAIGWYRNRSIVSLGHRTPETTVKAGHVELVFAYLEAVAAQSILP